MPEPGHDLIVNGVILCGKGSVTKTVGSHFNLVWGLGPGGRRHRLKTLRGSEYDIALWNEDARRVALYVWPPRGRT